MALLDEAGQQRVAAAIAAAEAGTSGEIVCVVAARASDYRTLPLVWASLAGFALPWPLIHLLGLEATAIYRAQLATVIVLAVILSLANWRFALVPGFVKRRRARLAAREQFFAQGLHRTRRRTGLLIYVAEAERYAEIIADDGLAGVADETFWRDRMAALAQALRERRAAEGLVACIEACAPRLAEAAPRAADDRNELPNRVVML